jgi:hypothetical protein
MIKATDLIKKQKELDNRKKITYDKIYNCVEKKISRASSGNFYHIWYQIPEFMVGLPIYSLPYCRKYIQDKLIENGFKTEYFPPNILLIKWDTES